VSGVLFDIEPSPIVVSAHDAPAVKLTERDMLNLLHQRFGVKSYNGAVAAERYVRAEHVRARSGFDRRTADFIAVDTWASGKLAIHGVEIKVSRSDWLRELKDPAKAEAFMCWCSHWWLAAANVSIARPEELPSGWGLMVATRRGLIARVPAPRRDVPPIPPESIASLLRAVAKTAADRITGVEPL
jgi:hypothetical protein